MGMEFAKYYNVTDKMRKMCEKEDTKLYSYKSSEDIKGVFICLDTNDFWVCRILKGYNKEYDLEDGKWLVERNKIDQFDIIDAIEEDKNEDYGVCSKMARHTFIDCFDVDSLIEYILKYDDEEGLGNWDIYECDSYDEAVEVIDGGYGIIEYKGV